MSNSPNLAKSERDGNRLIIGCGYLGKKVARQWLSHGGRVFALTRSQSRAEQLRSDGLQPIVGDVLQLESLEDLPEVASVLCAVGHSRRSGHSLHSMYVEGLRNVLDRVRAPTRFLYVSSTGVYDQRDGAEVTEESDTSPTEESAQAVLEAEKLLKERLPEAIILRFAGIYGPGRLLREDNIRSGEPLATDANLWLNLIHVDDGAAAVERAERLGRPGATYNICDDHPVLRGEFFQHMANLLGAPAPKFDAGVVIGKSANRRISNRKMHEDLKVPLQYPSFQEGLASSLADHLLV
jgi:nucleoside-diphosphate-sugar epimerase